jgi:hypothetical protein
VRVVVKGYPDETGEEVGVEYFHFVLSLYAPRSDGVVICSSVFPIIHAFGYGLPMVEGRRWANLVKV